MCLIPADRQDMQRSRIVAFSMTWMQLNKSSPGSRKLGYSNGRRPPVAKMTAIEGPNENGSAVVKVSLSTQDAHGIRSFLLRKASCIGFTISKMGLDQPAAGRAPFALICRAEDNVVFFQTATSKLVRTALKDLGLLLLPHTEVSASFER